MNCSKINLVLTQISKQFLFAFIGLKLQTQFENFYINVYRTKFKGRTARMDRSDLRKHVQRKNRRADTPFEKSEDSQLKS